MGRASPCGKEEMDLHSLPLRPGQWVQQTDATKGKAIRFLSPAATLRKCPNSMERVFPLHKATVPSLFGAG